jgi:hypothetical protein
VAILAGIAANDYSDRRQDNSRLGVQQRGRERNNWVDMLRCNSSVSGNGARHVGRTRFPSKSGRARICPLGAVGNHLDLFFPEFFLLRLSLAVKGRRWLVY